MCMGQAPTGRGRLWWLHLFLALFAPPGWVCCLIHLPPYVVPVCSEVAQQRQQAHPAPMMRPHPRMVRLCMW